MESISEIISQLTDCSIIRKIELGMKSMDIKSSIGKKYVK